MGSAGAWRSGIWGVMLLLLVGAAVQGCTNNTDRTGVSFPTAGQSGSSDAGVLASMSASPGPGGEQFLISVIVVSGISGRPIAGSTVIVTTTAGKLSPVRGVTNSDGEFVSVLTCPAPPAAPTVTALVEGLLLAVTLACV